MLCGSVRRSGSSGRRRKTNAPPPRLKRRKRTSDHPAPLSPLKPPKVNLKGMKNPSFSRRRLRLDLPKLVGRSRRTPGTRAPEYLKIRKNWDRHGAKEQQREMSIETWSRARTSSFAKRTSSSLVKVGR